MFDLDTKSTKIRPARRSGRRTKRYGPSRRGIPTLGRLPDERLAGFRPAEGTARYDPRRERTGLHGSSVRVAGERLAAMLAIHGYNAFEQASDNFDFILFPKKIVSRLAMAGLSHRSGRFSRRSRCRTSANTRSRSPLSLSGRPARAALRARHNLPETTHPFIYAHPDSSSR